MENDTDENEHETVIIAGGYEEAFQNSIQSGQLAVVHTQEIIEGSSHSGHEITTLTHTGPKSKYYKQTYRTAWENMPDFKGTNLNLMTPIDKKVYTYFLYFILCLLQAGYVVFQGKPQEHFAFIAKKLYMHID